MKEDRLSEMKINVDLCGYQKCWPKFTQHQFSRHDYFFYKKLTSHVQCKKPISDSLLLFKLIVDTTTCEDTGSLSVRLTGTM